MAGYLTNTLVGDAQMLAAMHPWRLRRVIQFADGSVNYSDGLIERLGIDCDYERIGNVIAAVTPAQAITMERPDPRQRWSRRRIRRRQRVRSTNSLSRRMAQGPYLGSLLADRLCGDEVSDDLQAVWRAQPRFAPSPASSPTAVRAA
ncbi:hypothetical protein [Nocardia sp. bgisy118]|uniref:hypothetical protein n=1 Tax=Nocardia sp. bgisy118 TaxID=3413786 RepID=UPI003F49B4DF